MNNPVMRNDPSGMVVSADDGEGGINVNPTLNHSSLPEINASGIYNNTINIASHGQSFCELNPESCVADPTGFYLTMGGAVIVGAVPPLIYTAPAIMVGATSLGPKIVGGVTSAWKIINGTRAKETTQNLLAEIESYGLQWENKSPVGKGSTGALVTKGRNDLFGATSLNDIAIGGKSVPRILAHELHHLKTVNDLINKYGTTAIAEYRAFQYPEEMGAYFAGGNMAFKTGDLIGASLQYFGVGQNYLQYLSVTGRADIAAQYGLITIKSYLDILKNNSSE